MPEQPPCRALILDLLKAHRLPSIVVREIPHLLVCHLIGQTLKLCNGFALLLRCEIGATAHSILQRLLGAVADLSATGTSRNLLPCVEHLVFDVCFERTDGARVGRRMAEHREDDIHVALDRSATTHLFERKQLHLVFWQIRSQLGHPLVLLPQVMQLFVPLLQGVLRGLTAALRWSIGPPRVLGHPWSMSCAMVQLTLVDRVLCSKNRLHFGLELLPLKPQPVLHVPCTAVGPRCAGPIVHAKGADRERALFLGDTVIG